MAINNIAFAKNFTSILDKVYQCSAVSGVLNSGRRIAWDDCNSCGIMIPKIEVTGLGDYVRNQGYKTGAITSTYGMMVPNCDRGVRLMADATKARHRSERHAGARFSIPIPNIGSCLSASCGHPLRQNLVCNPELCLANAINMIDSYFPDELCTFRVVGEFQV